MLVMGERLRDQVTKHNKVEKSLKNDREAVRLGRRQRVSAPKGKIANNEPERTAKPKERCRAYTDNDFNQRNGKSKKKGKINRRKRGKAETNK